MEIITYKEYSQASEIVNKFKTQCKEIRESRRGAVLDNIESLLFDRRKELVRYYNYEKKIANSSNYFKNYGRSNTVIMKEIKDILKLKHKK